MLIGIKPCISAELLSVLYRMGHGDEIVLADAFFCGDALNPRVVRADGIRIPDLLDGALRLINLDSYVDAPVIMMQPSEGDALDPRPGADTARSSTATGRTRLRSRAWSASLFTRGPRRLLPWS